MERLVLRRPLVPQHNHALFQLANGSRNEDTIPPTNPIL